MIIKGYLFSILYGIVCLGISLVLYKLGLDKKYTRKAVHILVGFESSGSLMNTLNQKF